MRRSSRLQPTTPVTPEARPGAPRWGPISYWRLTRFACRLPPSVNPGGKRPPGGDLYMAVSTLAAEIAQGDVTAAAAEERAKFQRHFARFDMLFFLICALVGLDTLGTVASYGAQ